MSWYGTVESGAVVGGLWRARQHAGQTELADNDPMVLAFLDLTKPRPIAGPQGVRLVADRVTNQGSYQDCTGLGFSLEADRHYGFSFDGAYHAAAAGTGIHIALNGPTFDFLGATFKVWTGEAAAPVTRVVGNYDLGPLPTASAGATRLIFEIRGNISTTAAGLLVVRFKSEVPGSNVTIIRGSQGILTPVR